MIAFDATANDLESGFTATFSHTCTGSDLILFVTAIVSSGNSVTGITYNGVAMTNVPTNSPVTNPNGTILYLFYLINPATGANNVVVTANSSDTMRAVSASYTGAKQSGQPDASGNGTASAATSITDSITTVADDCWLLAATTNTVDVAANGTGYVNRGNSGGVGIGDSNVALAPGVNSQTVNTSGSADWGIIQVSIAPSAVNSPSVSPSLSPSSSASRSASSSQSPSASGSASASRSASASASASISPSASGSASGSSSASKSLSPSASASPSISPSASPSPAEYTNNYSSAGNTYTDKYTSTL